MRILKMRKSLRRRISFFLGLDPLKERRISGLGFHFNLGFALIYLSVFNAGIDYYSLLLLSRCDSPKRNPLDELYFQALLFRA
jgi:hypothetical protein